jgi:polysaccharide export outer membrane protein
MSNNKLSVIILFFIGFGLLFFSSCSFKNRQALLKTPYDADTVKTVRVINGTANDDSYYNVIKPEDELAIRNVQDMSLIVKKQDGVSSNNQQVYATFKVNASGEVTLPKVGPIKVSGLNRSQAAEVIQKAYEAKELNAPLIDVRIANAYVVLLGEVAKQGKYVIEREDYELIDLLADAGGVNINANRKMVRIFRGDRSNPEIIMVNLNDYNFIKDPKLKLRAKDIVYIEPRRIASSSQNFQAYSSFIQIGLVVLNTALIIYNIAK